MEERHVGEADLVGALRRGDEDAFRSLVASLHPALVRMARLYVPPAVAEEVVQDTWVAVVEHRSRRWPPGSRPCGPVGQGEDADHHRDHTAAHSPELAGDLVGKALAITVVGDGPAPLVGVSFPLDRIPPCSP